MLGLIVLLIELELLGLEVPVLVVVLKVVKSDSRFLLCVFILLRLARRGLIITIFLMLIWARSRLCFCLILNLFIIWQFLTVALLFHELWRFSML
jgi:hypothetical protein